MEKMSFDDYQSDVSDLADEVVELDKVRAAREDALKWMRQAGVIAADIQAQNKRHMARREHLTSQPFAHLDGLIAAALESEG